MPPFNSQCFTFFYQNKDGTFFIKFACHRCFVWQVASISLFFALMQKETKDQGQPEGSAHLSG